MIEGTIMKKKEQISFCEIWTRVNIIQANGQDGCENMQSLF